MRQAGDHPRALYAHRRASALKRDLAPTLNRCGKRCKAMLCGCGTCSDRRPEVIVGRPALPEPVPPRRVVERELVRPATGEKTTAEGLAAFRCRQHLLCGECLRKRSRKLKARMASGLDTALARAREDWRRRGCPSGGRPEIVLLTLTIGHSGDVARDRDDLAAGWREFYRRLHRRGWNGPYVGAWEATSGRDKLGHVHMHVAIIWPRIPWDEHRGVRRLWLDACPRSSHIDIAGPRKDRKPTNAWSAAKYIGKYISKGASLAAMGARLAADIVAANYNKRTVITSRKFWVPWDVAACARCGVVPWAEQGYAFALDAAAEFEVERERVRRAQLADAQLLFDEDAAAFLDEWRRMNERSYT